MTHEELAEAFRQGRISRRAFVRQLVDDGVAMPDALARADSLVPRAEPTVPEERGGAGAATRPPTPSRPTRTPRLAIEFVGDGYLVHDGTGDRVHTLNHTAALILELCDGNTDASELAGILQRVYDLPSPPVAETRACLDSLHAEDLIR